MATRRKKPRGKVGRPKVAKQTEKDAGRLRDAVALLRYQSQSSAAGHAAMDQRVFNALYNGKRDFGREDLRKLAMAGISADYLLGADRELTPPGETRTQAKLEQDLAAAIERQLGSELPEGHRISGKSALATMVELVRADIEKYREMVKRLKVLDTAQKAVDYWGVGIDPNDREEPVRTKLIEALAHFEEVQLSLHEFTESIREEYARDSLLARVTTPTETNDVKA